MPFQKGNRIAKGGSRPGAGRKSRDREAELESVLKRAVDDDARARIFQVMAARAQSGDTRAATLLLSYLYGRPPSLDDSEIEARIESGLDAILNTIEAVLGKDSAEKVTAALADSNG